MAELTFALSGPFKPYVRMTQRGKWVKPAAQEYLSSKAALALQFRQQMAGEMIERGSPLSASIEIEHAQRFNHRDLDNEVKAILDAAQGVVFENDCWIDQITAWRWLGQFEQIIVKVWRIAK